MTAPATLYLVIGTHEHASPILCPNRTVAEAKAVVCNHEYPAMGPWTVAEYRHVAPAAREDAP